MIADLGSLRKKQVVIPLQFQSMTPREKRDFPQGLHEYLEEMKQKEKQKLEKKMEGEIHYLEKWHILLKKWNPRKLEQTNRNSRLYEKD